MKLVNFTANGRTSYGVLKEGPDGKIGVVDAGTRWAAIHPNLQSVLAAGALDLLRDSAAKSPADYPLEDVQLLKPLPGNGKILCVGINFPDHDERQGVTERAQYPSLFFRAPSALVAQGESLMRPAESPQLDYEGEIALIIGKKGRRIAEKDATAHIAGYTICNEGTVRDWQRHTKVNNTAGKNFDRSGALGPWIVTADEIPAGPMRIITRLNGEIRQDATTDEMFFPMTFLISYISRFSTLEPGDVIVTGTPPGTGARATPPRYLVPGDTVEVEVPGIGILRNSVADD
jgi:2-keto-4-pentenoate hydratase/2-oxohepta-3-ene-1,7-dioic acid hydratase in catechol pathway